VVWVIWGVPVAAAGWVAPGLWRRCGGQAGEGLAAPAPGSGGQAGGGTAGVVVLAGVPGGQDALVADGEQAGEPEGEQGQAHDPRPAAGDVVGGGVFGGGEGPLGAGAPGVGLAVRG
jgi:hypothetical protein